MGTPVKSFSAMSPRARTALVAAGLRTIEDAAALSDSALLAIQGVAEASVARLRAYQREHLNDPGMPPVPEGGASPRVNGAVSRGAVEALKARAVTLYLAYFNRDGWSPQLAERAARDAVALDRKLDEVLQKGESDGQRRGDSEAESV